MTSGFTPSDQAQGLRELVRRRRRGGSTVAITSGKGGVGKTSIAVNLSVWLASKGVRVTLVDVDLGLANADILLNIRPRYTLAHVLSGHRTIEEIVMDGPGGLRFIPGASGVQEVADLSDFDRQTFINQLARLRINTDITVLDCGAGLSRSILSFARSADRVVVVTTPEPPAVTDAYATIKALYQEHGTPPVGLFVNRAETRAMAEATFDRIAGVAHRFLKKSVANQGFMLQDRVVEAAVMARRPFVISDPASPASACIAALANTIVRTSSKEDRSGGWFRRVAGLFV